MHCVRDGGARGEALRKLRALLVDSCDSAPGTTNRLGQLKQGGLRYLEHFDPVLVRDSLRQEEHPRAIKSLVTVTVSEAAFQGAPARN